MEVKINKEIRDFEENIFFGFNKRQMIMLVIGGAIAVGVYFLFTTQFGWAIDLAIIPAAIVVLPFILVGFMKYNGETFDKVFMHLVRYIRTPKHLTCAVENRYTELVKEANEEDISNETQEEGKVSDQ